MAQYYTLVTDIGTKKIAEMIATGSKLNLVKLQLGDGGGAYYEPSTKQTALKNKVHEINVNSIKINAENQNWITIEGIVEAKVGGFHIREVGIFDDSNQLISIAKYSETYKPLPSEGTAKELVIRVVIDIDNVDSINMSVNADIAIATKDDIKNLEDDINEIENKIDSIKINNNFQAARGNGTEITIDIDMDTIRNGDSFTFIASANNNGSATTINSKPLYKPNTTTPPNTTSGKAYTIWYNAPSDCFFVQASAEGNAPQSSVLAGATFSNDNDTGLVGTMNDLRGNNVYCGAEGISSLNVYDGNSAYGQLKITPSPNQQPTGFINHTTTFETHLSHLIPSNIRAGVSIADRMTGTFTSDANAQAEHILSGHSAYVNGNKVHGNIPNRGDAQYAGGFGEGGDYYAMNNIPWGFYPNYGGNGWAPEIRFSKDSIRNHLGVAAHKIVSGQEIAGVWGNAAVVKHQSGTFSKNMTTPLTIVFPFEPKIVRFFNSARPSSMSANDMQLYISLSGGNTYLASYQGHTSRFTTYGVTVNSANPWSITFTRTSYMTWSDSYEAYGW